jgi:hypothetical protein
VIVLGALLLVWGGLVVGLAPMLHRNWKGMLADMRRAGVKNDIPLTGFFASETGLRRMRIAGAAAAAVGLAMIVAGLVVGRGIGG